MVHGHADGAIASARFSDNSAKSPISASPVFAVDQRNNLLDQVGTVIPYCRGVHVLASAITREAIRKDQDHFRHSVCDQPIHSFINGWNPWLKIKPASGGSR